MSERLTNEQLQTLAGYLPRCAYGGYYVDGEVKCGLPEDNTVEILLIIFGILFIGMIATIIYKTLAIFHKSNTNRLYNDQRFSLDLEALRNLQNPEFRPVPLYTPHPNPEVDIAVYDKQGNILEIPKPSKTYQRSIVERLPSYSRTPKQTPVKNSQTKRSIHRVRPPAPIAISNSTLPNTPPVYSCR